MSSEIKRIGWHGVHGMREDANGDYVLHSDHEAAVDSMTAALVKLDGACLASEQEAARLRAMAQDQGVKDGNEISRLRAELQNAVKAALDAMALSCEKEREADRLRAEVDAYKSLVRGIVDNRHKCFIPTDEPNSPTFNWDERADAAMGASA